MNAKQLKAAFFYKTPVFSDDKEHPVKHGYVTEVIYSLSDSGRRQAKGCVHPEDSEKASEDIELLEELTRDEKGTRMWLSDTGI